MKNIHIVMQSKGGVGKSFTAFLLAQYIMEKKALSLIDIDPSNQTLRQFFPTAAFVDVKKDGNISTVSFDKVFDMLGDLDSDVLIDSGSSNYIQLEDYMFKSNMLDTLHKMDYQPLLHMPISGGRSLDDCLRCINEVSLRLAEPKLILYINNRYGDEVFDSDNHCLQSLASFKDKTLAVVTYPNLGELLNYTLGLILETRKTFDTFAEKSVQVKFMKLPSLIWYNRAMQIKAQYWDALSVLDPYLF